MAILCLYSLFYFLNLCYCFIFLHLLELALFLFVCFFPLIFQLLIQNIIHGKFFSSYISSSSVLPCWHSFTLLSGSMSPVSWLRVNQWIISSISSTIYSVYLRFSLISRLQKFSSMKSINGKFTEEQNISGCVCYHAPVDCVSLLKCGLKSKELFLDLVRRSRHLRQMSM